MGLIVNLIVQTIVWFALIGAIIFGAAGTVDYFGGWRRDPKAAGDDQVGGKDIYFTAS